MSIFEKNYLNRKFKTGKDLSFEEIYADSKDEAKTMDDERETLDVRVLVAIFFLPLLLLSGRLMFLQSVHGSEYKALAEGNKLRATPTYAPRGLILDSRGKTIAQNMPNFELDTVPADLPKDPALIQAEISALAKVLNMDASVLAETVGTLDKKSYRTEVVVPSIPKDQALVLLAAAGSYKGFMVQNNPIRDYKDAQAFAPIVGYTGKITQTELDKNPDKGYLFNDYIGKTGLEVEYENYLRGVSGQKQSEIDASGNVVKSLVDIPPQTGDNIKLNIDYELQKIIYDNLSAALSKYHLSAGAAVATNPQNGKVLALVSLPSFDNNTFAHTISKDDYNALINNPSHPLLNRAIAGQYPPGSTVKPMEGLAALSEGVVKPDTKILDDGVIRVGSFTFYGYNHAGLGLMDVYSAIAKSSDIYFYTVGGGRAGTNIQGLGPDKLAEWFRKFHLGTVLGIDLPGEKNGLVPDPAWRKQATGQGWYLGDTYHLSIGQGDLLVTPLQLNSWTATIANGGTIYKPQILDQVVGHDDKVINSFAPQILSQGQFDPTNMKIVQDAMRQTVTAGTARSLQAVGMPISGKTGTAQFDARDLTRTHAWFTSFAPSDNPQIALTILMEDGGEGSTVCVPVAHAVYDWYVANRLNK